MKDKIMQLPPAVLIAIAVVGIAIAGYFGVKTFAPESSSAGKSTAAEIAAHQTNYKVGPGGGGGSAQQQGYASHYGQQPGGGGGQQPGSSGGQQPGSSGGR